MPHAIETLSSSNQWPLPKGVIFDCDGVVVDSRKVCRVTYNDLLSRKGLPAMTSEQEALAFACTARETIAMLFPDELRAWALETKENLGPEYYMPYLRLNQGVEYLLKALNRLGVPCALNTNSGQRGRVLLREFGIKDLFSQVVTALDVSDPKPDPEGVRLILHRWGMAAPDAAFIGDSAQDEYAAKSAGVRFWAYQSPELVAERYIDDFTLLAEEFLTCAKS